MDKLENLIGKSIFDIDSEIIDSLESINIKVAILEYKYKTCRKRYPSDAFKLDDIDYGKLISFSELFNFDKIFIFWHYHDIITDLEIFDITSDMKHLKTDYDLIVNKIKKGQAHNLRLGDTKLLGAKRLNEKVLINGKLTDKRVFVLKKHYLQKILNEIG